MKKILNVINDIKDEIPLDPKYREHGLAGDYIGFKECHIEPDWLLIYLINEDEQEVYFARTGTHADFF